MTFCCLYLIAEPDDADRKKKTSKSKTKGSIPKPGADSKPNISYPTVRLIKVNESTQIILGE